jgi:hypothetical protein
MMRPLVLTAILVLATGCVSWTGQHNVVLPSSGDLLIAPLSPEGKVVASNFLQRLQAGVRNNDMPAIASAVRYPLMVNGRPYIYTRDDFLNYTSRLITPEVKAAILEQRPEALVLTSEGILLGNGVVWLDSHCSLSKFDSDCRDEGIQIIAINTGTK